MSLWKRTLRVGAVAGSVASLTSMAALLAAGGRQTGAPLAPLNAVSHWIWGDRALRQEQADLRHTLAGYLIHHAASVFWGVIYAGASARRPARHPPAPALAGAVATSAAACLVDMRLTPHRLTPGFQHHLSRPALGLVYGSFAVGLAVGALLAARR